MGFKKSILVCGALSVCLAMVAAGDDWANFGRYEAQNAEVLQLPAKERNVVSWVIQLLRIGHASILNFSKNTALCREASAVRLLINSCSVSVMML